MGDPKLLNLEALDTQHTSDMKSSNLFSLRGRFDRQSQESETTLDPISYDNQGGIAYPCQQQQPTMSFALRSKPRPHNPTDISLLSQCWPVPSESTFSQEEHQGKMGTGGMPQVAYHSMESRYTLMPSQDHDSVLPEQYMFNPYFDMIPTSSFDAYPTYGVSQQPLAMSSNENAIHFDTCAGDAAPLEYPEQPFEPLQKLENITPSPFWTGLAGILSPPDTRETTPLDEFMSRASDTTSQSPEALGNEEQAADQPYAKLIYKAMMEAPGHRMSLREIYAWFTEKTNKTRGKGWQNSIRHNLSMNKAFESAKFDDASPRSRSKKPGNVWVLTEMAIREGVQSTTRYRLKSGNIRNSCKVGVSGSRRQQPGAKGGQAASKAGKLRLKRQYSSRASDLDDATLASDLQTLQPALLDLKPEGDLGFTNETATFPTPALHYDGGDCMDTSQRTALDDEFPLFDPGLIHTEAL